MKATGIIRKLDPLGRVVIPIEIRKTLEIDHEALEIFVDDDAIVMKKYKPSCVFCDNTDGIVKYKGKSVCSSCLNELASKK